MWILKICELYGSDMQYFGMRVVICGNIDIFDLEQRNV
jgi:hypothetical protein